MKIARPGLYASVLLAATLLSGAGSARADDGENSVFCAWAQQIIASTDVRANVITQTNFDNFVKSKASDSPLTVQQYWSNPAGGEGGMPRVVSCKMKTAERINRAMRAVEESSAPVAGEDTSCDLVHRKVLEAILGRIPRDELAMPADSLRVEENELTFIGPMWLKPWPFEPLYRDEAGLLHLRSRALYVPFAWWIPMPDRFKGTHYCHLIAPDFLEAVLRGEVDPGV